MMRKFFLQLFFVLVILLVFPLFKSSLAASLLFDPTSVNPPVDQTFEVNVNIDTAAEEVTSTDIWILYDKNLVEVQQVKNGSFFPVVSHEMGTAGKVYIAGMVADAAMSKKGTGTVASVIFKGKIDGSGYLTFDCTQGSTTDSNINKNDLNATDIIQCASNNKLSVIVGAGGPTATTYPEQVTPAVSVPTALPQSGIFDNVVKYSVPGAILFFVGLAAKLML